jgi:hypothetical protein
MISIDFNNGIVQATPIAGAAATDAVSRLVLGLTLNEWFYVSAILYTFVMTGLAVYKAIKETTPKE